MQGKYINCYKNLAFGRKLMYKFERYHQLGLADFNQPAGLTMNLVRTAEQWFLMQPVPRRRSLSRRM